MHDTPSTNEQAGPPDSSLAKLALGVIISPIATFDQILRRELVLPGLLIMVTAGTVAAIGVLLSFYYRSQGSLFELGSSSPTGELGALLIIALVVDGLARLMRGQGSYIQTLTVLAWANAVRVAALLLSLSPALSAFSSVVQLWAIVVSIIGVRKAHKFSGLRSVIAYLVGLLVTATLYSLLRSYYLTAAYPATAREVTSLAAASVPAQIVASWLCAAALVLAALALSRDDGAAYSSLRRLIGTFAAMGIAVAALTTGYAWKLDPVREVVRGTVAYQDQERPDPAQAAKHFRTALRYYPSDIQVELYLADSLSAVGDYQGAVKWYEKVREDAGWRVWFEGLAFTGIGTVRYLEGSYKAADDELRRAAKFWEGYAEPKARLGLVYLRLGKGKDAIGAANSAVKAGDKGYLPQVVLAQAYTTTGDGKKAQEAIRNVGRINSELAGRLGAGPGGWSRAIDRLTPVDLRMPLEMPKVPLPQRPKS
jgi:tetratricopeptide (TPR) repeat protein